ncbi:MAG: hypothetical protein LPK11_02945 [Chromatiaceae bacterium]|nr:hypothetical protein [Chromatiaceae bacterium]
MRSPAPKLAADSSFVRELKRLMTRLTAVSDAESLVSLFSDSLRYNDFAKGIAGERLPNNPAIQPALTAQLWFLAEKMLGLIEGSTAADTLVRSARLLGCLQLTAPVSPRRWRELQFGYKLLYRATLSLRLLDHALAHKLITEPALLLHFDQRQPQNPDCSYRLQVQMPLLVALMLLDAGQLDGKAQRLLTGYSGELDSSRALSVEERAEYLQLIQAGSQRLAEQALVVLPYRGNDKQQRQQHQHSEQQKLALVRLLLEQQQQPLSLLGNLLKIPQVYSSMVLPGRQRYVYEALPKASLLLKDSARRDQLHSTLVEHFLQITGIFPQGFGIAFTPQQHDGSQQERYELAIVNQLYPPNIAEPLCRVVSRNLQYRRGGQNIRISIAHNLYFKPARQRLATIPKQRLQDILTQLSADWQPGQIRSFIPRCWHPEQFFQQAEHQNLWNNAVLKHN